MKKKGQSIIAAAAIFAALVVVVAASRAEDAKSDAIANEIEQMTWFKNTTVTLPNSHGKLVIPDSYAAILGHDAKRLDEIINGKSSQKGSEATVLSSDLKAQTDFDFVQSGYSVMQRILARPLKE